MSAPSPVLSHLRWRLVGFLGLCVALGLWCVVSLLAHLAAVLDVVVILPDGARARAPWALAAGGAAVLAAGAWALRRLSQARAARRFERAFPALGTQLTNAVELAARSYAAPASELLRRQAVELGRRRAREARAWPVVRRGVATWCAAALVVAALWGAGWLLFGDVLRAVLPRFLDPRGDHPPYSRLRIAVEPGDTEVLYGGQCQVRATVAGAPAARLYLVARGARKRGQSTFRDEKLNVPFSETPMFVAPDQSFFQTIVNLREETEYYVTDGRARSHRHSIGIRRTPQITMVEVHTEFPAYTGKGARAEQLAGEALGRSLERSLPIGTRMRFRVASNRPLASGSLELTPVLGGRKTTVPLVARKRGQSTFRDEKLNVPFSETAVEGGFEVREAVAFSLSVTDTDGLACSEPRQGRVMVLPDRRPTIAVLEPGRDAVATPSVAIPVRVQAEDDYAVTRILWYRGLNRSAERPQDMAFAAKAGTGFVEAESALRLGELGVRPGDVVEYFFEAVDNDPRGPNVTTSRPYRVQVISEEEYQEILRREAARKALFESYRSLGQWLRRMAERADALAKKADELARKGGGTAAERQALRDEAAAIAKEMAGYRRSLRRTLAQRSLFDIEGHFRKTLAEQERVLERLQERLEGEGALSPEELAKLAKGLGGLAGIEDAQVGEPVRLLLAVVRVIARAQIFVRLYQEQVEIVRLAERFKEKKGKLSALEERELEELSRREGEVRGELEELLRELPGLLDDLPPDKEYDELRKTAREFIEGVRKARILEDLETAGRKFHDLDGAGGHAAASSAAEKMKEFIAQVEPGSLVGIGRLCLRFHPVLGEAMADALGQILGALGMGGGQTGQGGDGYSLFAGNVALYGPDAELARSEEGGEGGTAAGGAAPRRTQSARDAADPQLPRAAGPPRVKLQRDAKFPLRYRELVGDYFRAVAEAQSQ